MRLFGFGKRQPPEDCSERLEPQNLPYPPMYPGRVRANPPTPMHADDEKLSSPEKSWPSLPQLLIRAQEHRHITRPWYKKEWESGKRFFTAGQKT